MIDHHERTRLLQSYSDETVRPLAVLLKCAACLLLVALVALFGASPAPDGGVPAVHAQTQQ